MSSKYPYLEDSTFLELFDREPLKEQYVKVTLLTFNEKPIRAIEGSIISGSLNLDGNSSVRRTCTLNMLADKYKNDLTNLDSLISINKKLNLEIGFLNTTQYYQEYNIIWYPLGVYVITNPNLSFNASGVQISLQLKDKMALLNGECGGVLPAAVTFSEYDTTDENGKIVTEYPTIYQIIQEVVNHFGGEQLSKIIISDVDLRIKQVMKWIGSSPAYLMKDVGESGGVSYYLSTNINESASSIQTFSYGDDIGYIYTDFIYSGGELVGEAGESVCDVLDKIKNYLGNYEYYYDLDGNFIFQEIKNYLNTTQATVELDKMNNSDYLLDMRKGKAVYVFDDSTLITAYTNTPQYQNIKNDFIVWGKKQNANGNDVAIRYHLAIDEKPLLDDTYQVFFYDDPNDGLTKAKCPIKYASKDQFPYPGAEEIFYMDTSTGLIYKWNADVARTGGDDPYGDPIMDSNRLVDVQPQDWRTALYLAGACGEPFGKDSNYYYTELANEWPKLYDIYGENEDGTHGHFFEEVLKYPCDIDYFLDFIDSNAAISEISVNNIGRRTYTVVDEDINCVFEPEIPNFVFIEAGTEYTRREADECISQDQPYIQVSSTIYSMLAGGGSHNSAYNYVRELLYQYTSYNESITLTALPIYYLEPNTRITVRNAQTGIYGDFMMTTISLPLDVAGTMTISGTRALERI